MNESFSPSGEGMQFAESTGRTAKELMAMIGEVEDERVEAKSEKQKQREKYLAEAGLMKKSKKFYDANHVKHENDPALKPGEQTIEDGLRMAYEDGKGLDEEQILFAHFMIDSYIERKREKLLEDKYDVLNVEQRKSLKRTKAYFRNELRTVVQQSKGGIRQEDLVDWLGVFGGDPEWASRVVDEEAAVIAMHDYFDNSDDMHVVYVSPDEEALGGYAMRVVTKSGGSSNISAKSLDRPEGYVRPENNVLNIGVPESQVEDFKLKTAKDAQGLAELIDSMSKGSNVVHTSESRS